MGYTQHYKKENCKATKEVDFKKFETVAQLKVPPQIKESFLKKVGTPAKPFDVFIEADGDNGKCRIVIKKLATGDATVEWTDMATRGLDVAVTKIKQEISTWQYTVEDYNVKLANVADHVKTQKELIKALESNPGDPQIGQKIANIRTALQKAAADATEVFHKFDKWYLEGPRKGTAPLLVAHKVDRAKIAKSDDDIFNTAVMNISQQGNQVRNTFQVGVADAVKGLLARLDNFTSQVTKSNQEAVADVRANMARAIGELKDHGARMISGLKLAHSIQQGQDFKARQGELFERLKDQPKIIEATIAGNDTRIQSADTDMAMFDKTASRIRSGIPAAFQRDPQIMKLNQELIAMVNDFNKTVVEGKRGLAEANQHLDAYLKGHGPGRPTGSPNAQATGQ